MVIIWHVNFGLFLVPVNSLETKGNITFLPSSKFYVASYFSSSTTFEGDTLSVNSLIETFFTR